MSRTGSKLLDREPHVPGPAHKGLGNDLVKRVVEELSDPSSYNQVYFRDIHSVAMPSVKTLRQIVAELRSILFPGYFGDTNLKPETMAYYLGAALDRVIDMIREQFDSSLCIACFENEGDYCNVCHVEARERTARFIACLPEIRRKLATDVEAAYTGDPSCKGRDEAIYCFPSIKALTSYRIAHEMYRLDIPIVPRLMTELAHSETGIDIHPGAQIGEHFFIDHGTGTVIGETAIIGNNVRLYQGVTLGAKSFPKDENGNPIKGIPRHPVVEDDVIIYSGATILGRVTVGKGAVIGGNVWLTRDVPPGARITQHQPRKEFFENGGGI